MYRIAYGLISNNILRSSQTAQKGFSRSIFTSISRSLHTSSVNRNFSQTGLARSHHDVNWQSKPASCKRAMSHGICFSPFPRNELQILEFNLRQQIKQRRLQFEKNTSQLIEDMKNGKIPVSMDEKAISERLRTEMKRQLTSREQRLLRAELMKAFDPPRYIKWVRDEEQKLTTAVQNSVKYIREMQKSSVDRVVMTRNKAALILSRYLDRYPDREETERLWDQKFLLPSVEWDEGGDFTRSSTVGSDIGFGHGGNECL